MVQFTEENSNQNNFFFPAEKESVCIRKRSVSVNSTGHDLHTSFCNTHGDFHTGKTDI